MLVFQRSSNDGTTASARRMEKPSGPAPAQRNGREIFEQALPSVESQFANGSMEANYDTVGILGSWNRMAHAHMRLHMVC